VTLLRTVSVPSVEPVLDHTSPALSTDIGVVAAIALHLVGAGAAVEDIGGIVAGEIVGKAIAGAVDRRGAGE
jgi:hypothetical protein